MYSLCCYPMYKLLFYDKYEVTKEKTSSLPDIFLIKALPLDRGFLPLRHVFHAPRVVWNVSLNRNILGGCSVT